MPQQPEIVAVAFQEIVELSPQQIMNSDPTRKEVWEQAVRKCLNDNARAVGGEGYVLLRSGQLVGAALCIFIKSSVLRHVKNVEGNVKKTGMSGMAGNKGAVAIRMDFASTQICFVTAHLAAGFANYDERNRNYTFIQQDLRFQRDRSIDNHGTCPVLSSSAADLQIVSYGWETSITELDSRRNGQKSLLSRVILIPSTPMTRYVGENL